MLKGIGLLISIIAYIIFINSTYAETLTYRSEKYGNIVYQIDKTDSGYIVQLNSELVKNISYTDSFYALMKWIYIIKSENTDLAAERSGNIISVTGKYKNKPVDEKVKIDDSPWYYVYSLGLKDFLLSENDTAFYWKLEPAVSLKGAGKIKVKKEKTEKIVIDGKETETIRAKLNLTGMFRFFWSGDIWFRKTDGRVVKLRDGDSVLELIDEK